MINLKVKEKKRSEIKIIRIIKEKPVRPKGFS